MGNSVPISEKIDHPRLGPVSILQIDDQPAMQYVVSVHHEQAQKQWEDALKEFRGRKQYECMFVPSSFEVEKVPCGISRNLKAIYPYFPFSLKSEIENRVGLSAPFEEKELQYLLFELLDLAKEFEKACHKAGNIKPDNILINNDGEVSIITRYSYPGFVDGYASALYDKEVSLLAPEEMKHLETGDEECGVDPNKAEAFSIGMTILSAGLLDNLEGIYNFKQAKFDSVKFETVLHQWKQHSKYSGFFKMLVERLVALDPSERLSPGELRAYLAPYEDSIRTLENYQPSYQLSQSYLFQYRQSKVKPAKGQTPEPEKVASKGIRQLGAKFSRKDNTKQSGIRDSNRQTTQLDRTATKTTGAFGDRPMIPNIDSARTSRDTITFTSAQPLNQYVVYKPAPTVTFTTIPTYPTATFTPGCTYTSPISHTAHNTNFAYIYPQQPPQPLSVAGPIAKPQLPKKQPAVETVQEMLKEFKAELSGQKSDKPEQPGPDSMPEPSNEQTIEQK